MKVLSLFDGMSCGQIALNRLGIKVDKYYASEIDKYAIQVTQANFPKTIQIGDVCDIKAEDYQDVDLIMAGSPCQGFSFAGKQLAFDDPRSALFFEFIRLLKEIKPKYFLLENVKMKKEYLQVISEQVSACYPEIPFGIEPIFINSSLVSAQSRQRYYWTNIPNITQPEERGIVLRDILETDADTFLSEEAIAYMNRGSEKYTGKKTRAEHYIKHESEKSKTLTANMHKGVPYGVIAIDKPKQVGKVKDGGQGNRIYSQDGKGITLSAQSGGTAGNGNMLVETSDKPEHIGTAVDVNGHDILKRVYSPDGKSPTVTTCQGGNTEPKVVAGAWRGRYNEDGSTSQKLELTKDTKSNSLTTVQKDNVLTKNKVYWRKLTPLECERLQTVPDNYTNHVSNTRRYQMLGNGWTIEVICHILKNMELDT